MCVELQKEHDFMASISRNNLILPIQQCFKPALYSILIFMQQIYENLRKGITFCIVECSRIKCHVCKREACQVVTIRNTITVVNNVPERG